MGVLDAPLRAVAKTLVPKFGTTTGAIVRDGTYDEATDTVGSPTEYSCSVVFESFAAHLVDGDVVQEGDQIAHVAAADLTITPTPATDALQVGTETWDVVRVMRVQPGATVILYSLHVRR